MKTTDKQARELNKRLITAFHSNREAGRFDDPDGLLIIPEQKEGYYEHLAISPTYTPWRVK